MKPYSMDLRQRVLEDCDAGATTSVVAAKFRVSPAWVRRLKQRRRESGEVAPRPPVNRRRRVLADHLGRLRELVHRRPDATIDELRGRLGLPVGRSTLARALRELKLSVKKKCSAPPSGPAPMWPSVAPAGGSR